MAVVFGESFMFLLPLLLTLLSVIACKILRSKFIIPIAIGLIILSSVSFYYLLAMALTIGALGAVMALLFFTILPVIALSEIYLRK